MYTKFPAAQTPFSEALGLEREHQKHFSISTELQIKQTLKPSLLIRL